ncbi:MAG: hypothetical protein AMJ81_06195 [Phycisphaerae bacterium SM23_33]|nr:MAG: hypothetical protein AMJ81_06195 [Phycisphaerae bacterium SM23_33]
MLIVALAATAAPAADANSYWTDAAGGDWNDNANWDTASYPDNGNGGVATYAAFIDLVSGSPYSVTLNTNITIEAFTLDSSAATLNHTGGTFTVTDTADLLAGTYSLAGGTINGSGAWTVGDGVHATSMDWSGGTMTGRDVDGLVGGHDDRLGQDDDRLGRGADDLGHQLEVPRPRPGQ